MSKEITTKVDILDEKSENSVKNLEKFLETKPEAIIFCQSKKNNPNYFSIIFANQKFFETFDISKFNTVGKNYDFLFSDLDLNYSSRDHQEYVHLIKSVKDLKPCLASITIPNHKSKLSKIRLKINFQPLDLGNNKNHYATFSFEKTEAINDEKIDSKEESKTATVLLKNLERALRNEQVLREVGSFIISDLPIQEIAQKIAKVLCEHLKVDRCLIHDYRNGQTSFVVEHQNEYTAKILDNKQEDNLKMLVDYINFQNHFFERYGNKEKKNALFLIEDVESDQNFEKIRPICEKFSIASQIAVTTIFNKKVNGGIYIHQSDKKTWLTDEIELLEMVANQFSIAVDRSESIERVMVANHSLMERTSQLKEALKQEKEMRQMQNEFVALVSHEFKTPLQIIDGTRELLVRKIKNLNIVDDSLNKAFERIKSGIQRMNGLIHSTLNLARMESGEGKIKVEKQVFDLKNFVFEIIEKNSNLAINKQIKIITKIDELPTEFEGDPKLLDHSITNIISNAIKYSKNNTSVKIISKSNRKKVALRVIDQGIGIPKEDLANIGQKFFRAKNTLAVAGTGIGVYLTKHFIELHEGKVLIESEVNVGTSVTITLPNRYT